MTILNYVPVKSCGRIKVLPVEEIIWIKAAANYVEIQTDARKMRHRDSICAMAAKLDQNRFVRVHRSVIVNLNYVDEIAKDLGHYSVLCMRNGDQIRIGNSYRKRLFGYLGLEA